jgi:hypothetical protein
MNKLFKRYQKWLARCGLLFTVAIASALPGTTLAALLGNTLDLPFISYDNQGTTTYDAVNDIFSVNASPLAILVSGNLPAIISGPESFIINVTVDATGALTGGVPGDDLVVTGQAAVPGLGSVSGVLLTGEVTGFGFEDSSGTTDKFDFTFTVTGGQLASLYPQTIGVSLNSEQSNFTGDFTVNFDGEAKGTLGGLPEPCALAVDKTCLVLTPPPGDYVCTKPIDELTMIWNGPQAPGETVTIKAYKGDTNDELLDEISGVKVGDEVTVSGYTGSPNDVIWEIFDANGNKLGESTFHLSCSDQGMDGAEDCGMAEGDGKDKSGFLNDWLLEGIVDAGGELNCTADEPLPGAKECEIPSQDGELCTQRPTEISFRFNAGDDCTVSSNTQDSGKWSCSDIAATGAPVQIIVSKPDGNNVSLDTGPGATVNDGDAVTATAANAGRSDFDSESRIQILDGNGGLLQDITLHTSCSQDLRIGDRFGAIEVVGFVNAEQGSVQSGTEVKYTYVVSNTGNVDLTGITVQDDGLVPTTVPGSPIDLLAGEVTDPPLMATVFVTEPVTNTVTVKGIAPDGTECSAMDTNTVTVAETPPCTVSGEPTIKLDKKKLEWNITNTGTQPAVIDRIEISWPNDINGFLDKVKVGKHEIVSANQPGPSAVMTTFVGDPKHLKIDPGKTVKMKFEFEHNVSKTVSDYGILQIGFAEGCEVVFDPANVPFVCKDAKPIDSLSMIWAGPDGVDVTSPTGAMVAGVINGDEVTFSGLSGLGNDIVWDITGAVDGISTFHVSCSDDDMNGPEDCGTLQGDGKNNDSGLNLWLFEGMAGSNGIGFDCSALP